MNTLDREILDGGMIPVFEGWHRNFHVKVFTAVKTKEYVVAVRYGMPEYTQGHYAVLYNHIVIHENPQRLRLKKILTFRNMTSVDGRDECARKIVLFMMKEFPLSGQDLFHTLDNVFLFGQKSGRNELRHGMRLLLEPE